MTINRFSGDNSGTGPSMAIWNDCPVLEIISNPNAGYILFDDFLNFSQHVSDQDTQQYSSYIDTGCTIKQSAGEVGGAIAMVQDGTDNDEIWMTAGGNAGAAFKIYSSAMKSLWFEARLKISAITDDYAALFIGLTEEGLAAADTKTDNTGAMASKDYIGFNSVHVNGGTTGTNALVNAVYSKAGQTAQTLISSAHTLVADTYVKLGFKYDANDADGNKRLRFYVNGTEQSTYITDALLSAATFPNGEELTPLVGFKAGTGQASTLTMDWWRVAQLR